MIRDLSVLPVILNEMRGYPQREYTSNKCIFSVNGKCTKKLGNCDGYKLYNCKKKKTR